LQEFGARVDVEEESIVEALGLHGVPRPHVQAELMDSFLLLGVEEFGKTPDLLVFLFVKAELNYPVHECHHVLD